MADSDNPDTRITISIERGYDYEGDSYWASVVQVKLPLVGKLSGNGKDRLLRDLVADLSTRAAEADAPLKPV